MTVERAANGSTAAAHNTATAIYRYVYPAPVVEACLAASQASRGGGLVAAASGVKRRRAGDLEIEYATASDSAESPSVATFNFGPWLAGYRRAVPLA
jgi:hypothetical protein